MGNWRKVAAEAMQRHDTGGGPVADTFGLPEGLAADLRRLERMPPPKLETPGNWRGVVSDALTIARDGWAAKALALGWSAGDLFGVGPRDDWDFEGVAVWLGGWRLVALDEHVAVAVSPAGERRYFVRGGARHGTQPVIVPVMLWDFGR